MPRKKLKDSNSKDTKFNRIRPAMNQLIGIEDPDDLMINILGLLRQTVLIPDVGRYYTFVYAPKTPNIRYDSHPLVAVTEIYRWGFKAINFHWGEIRQYTWEEIVGSLHVIYSQELKDLKALPFGKIKMS
jgi:hypothetical protein